MNDDVPSDLWYDRMQTLGIFNLETKTFHSKCRDVPIIFLMSERLNCDFCCCKYVKPGGCDLKIDADR